MPEETLANSDGKIVLDLSKIKDNAESSRNWVKNNFNALKESVQTKTLEDNFELVDGRGEPIDKITSPLVIKVARYGKGEMVCTWSGLIIGLLIRFGIAKTRGKDNVCKAINNYILKYVVPYKSKYPQTIDDLRNNSKQKTLCCHTDILKNIEKVEKSCSLVALSNIAGVKQEGIAAGGSSSSANNNGDADIDDLLQGESDK